jgi:hypothetical protein
MSVISVLNAFFPRGENRTATPFLNYNSNPNQFASVFKPRLSNGPFKIPASNNGKYGVKHGIASLPTWPDYRKPGNMEYDMEASKIMAGFSDEQMRRFQMYMDTQFNPGTRENLEFLKRTVPDWNKPRTEIINCKLELMKRLMFLKISGPSKMEDWLLLFLVEDGELLFPQDIKSLIYPQDPNDDNDEKIVEDWFKKTTKPVSRYTYFTVPLERNIQFMSNLFMFPFDFEGRQGSVDVDNLTTISSYATRTMRTTGDLALSTAVVLYNSIRGRGFNINQTQNRNINNALDYLWRLEYLPGSDIVNLYRNNPGVIRRLGNNIYRILNTYHNFVTRFPNQVYDTVFFILPSQGRIILVPAINFGMQLMAGAVFQTLFGPFIGSGTVVTSEGGIQRGFTNMYELFRVTTLVSPLKALFLSNRGYNLSSNLVRAYLWMGYNLYIPIYYNLVFTMVNWVIAMGYSTGSVINLTIPDFLGNLGASLIFPAHVIGVAQANERVELGVGMFENVFGQNFVTNTFQYLWAALGTVAVEETADFFGNINNPDVDIFNSTSRQLSDPFNSDREDYIQDSTVNFFSRLSENPSGALTIMGGAGLSIFTAYTAYEIVNWATRQNLNAVRYAAGQIDRTTFIESTRYNRRSNRVANNYLIRPGNRFLTNVRTTVADNVVNPGLRLLTDGRNTLSNTVNNFISSLWTRSTSAETQQREEYNLFFDINSNLNNITVIYNRIYNGRTAEYLSNLVDYSYRDPGYVLISELINVRNNEVKDYIIYYVNGIRKLYNINTDYEIFKDASLITVDGNRYIQLNQEMLRYIVESNPLSREDVVYNEDYVNRFTDEYQTERIPSYAERLVKNVFKATSDRTTQVVDAAYTGVTFFTGMFTGNNSSLFDIQIN